MTEKHSISESRVPRTGGMKTPALASWADTRLWHPRLLLTCFLDSANIDSVPRTQARPGSGLAAVSTGTRCSSSPGRWEGCVEPSPLVETSGLRAPPLATLTPVFSVGN